MADDVFGILGTTQAAVFRVERVVAEGGFAVVYKAFHTGFRSPVALKCLKIPDAMTQDQRSAFLEKFREEGELLFRLSALNPAVVRPLHVDVLMIDGRMVPFLALEWLEGEGLDRIIEQRRLSGKEPIDVRRAVEFLTPAAHAIAQAHHLPGPDGPVTVVHRDLKPENIFVTKAQGGEVVKILDFGIARTKSAASVDQPSTQSSTMDAFTPGYAAPEQWQPLRFGEAGPWTDVFGLALTTVELITGVVAIDGDLGQMMNIALDPAKRPTPRTLGMSVPDSVERAFARALAVDPRERSRSIEDFWSELEVALGFAPSVRTSMNPVADRVRRFTSEPPPLSQPISSSRGRSPMPTVPPAPLLPKIDGESIRPPSSVRRPLSSPVPPPATGPAPAFELAEEPRSLPPSRAGRTSPPSGSSSIPAAPSSAPSSAPRSMRAPSSAPRSMQPPAAHVITPEERDAPTARDLLKVPVALIALGVLIGLSDWIYAQASGELVHIGGLRPVWIAAPLAVIGVGMACWRLVGLL